MVGPIAGANVAEIANIASPIGCFAFGSSVMISVKAIGISTPPVKPCTARSTIICGRFLRERAGRREHQEQDGVGEEIDADREHLGEPTTQGDHHDLGDQVGRRDPAAIIDARADPALDIGKGGIDDLDVEHRHEGAQRGAAHREPGFCGDGGSRRCNWSSLAGVALMVVCSVVMVVSSRAKERLASFSCGACRHATRPAFRLRARRQRPTWC